MVSYIEIFLDLMLFKLSFHTYEALSNKKKAARRKTLVMQNIPEMEIDENLELASNADSDESTMTLGGPS